MKKITFWKSFFLLFALIVGSMNVWGQSDYSADHEGNVSLSTTGSTNGYDASVVINLTTYDAIKIGKNKTAGSFNITAPKGTKYLHIHVAAWKDKTPTLSVKNGSTTIVSGLELASDNELTGTATSFGLDKDKASDEFYKVVTLTTALNEESTLTISTSNERAVVWGITTEALAAGTTAAPTINGNTTFLDNTTVTISNAASADGADIFYTLNGDDPTTTTSATCFAYSAPFEVSTTTTIKAIAKKSTDTNASSVVSKAFTKVTPLTVAEALSAIDELEDNGTIADKYVTGIISQIDDYNSTYKTITYWISADGTTTSQLEVYNGKGLKGADFSASSDLTVGDIVVVSGTLKKYVSGNTTTPEFNSGSQLFSLTPKVKDPTFSPVAGAVATGTTVTLSTTTEGATIYYTTNGDNPTKASTVYAAPITINDETTIKAFAVKDGCPDSDIAQAAYTIATPCATPTFTIAAGTYYSAQEVELETETEGATIYYTIDGSDPTTDDYEYTEAITVSTSKTIRAIAAKDGMANSPVAEAAYTINIPVVTLANNTITANYNDASKTVDVTYDFINLETKPTIKFYESNGTTETTYTWAEATIDDDNKLAFTFDENTLSTARTGYLKISAKAVDNSDVTSALITFKQNGIDYATLPFSYDGNGTGTLPSGLTPYGLGTYSSSPKMQFNGTGDYLILKINEAPGKLSFKIKGNGYSSGSTSTFKVQTSADGETYTDLATYTELGDAQTKSFNNLPTNVRYIKWIYVQKGSSSGGNVALGAINLIKTIDTPTVSAAGWATYVTKTNLQFEENVAFVVTAANDKINAVSVTKVPADIPLLLKGEGVKTATVLDETPEAPTTNLLAISDGTKGVNDYVLYKDDTHGVGFYKWAGSALAAGKVYLPADAVGNARSFIGFEENVANGINSLGNLTNSQLDNVAPMYNLAGQRVNKNYKGVVIVNGKKMLNK